MPFPQDLTRFIANDYASDRRAALLITLLRQKKGDAHEVPVRKFPEKPGIDNLGKTPGRKMNNGVQDFIGHRSIFCDEGFHNRSFWGRCGKAHLAAYPFSKK